MTDRQPGLRSHLTLFLCTILHAFTHAYGSMLVPLYLLMVADLHLPGVKRASLLLSLYTFVYCIGSYAAGILADRFNRKWLLTAGLLTNAVAITLIGLTRRYDLMLVWAVLAGVGGTIFHPAAGALVPAHYPKSPGMAIGLLGIGSGLGFFVGPQFAGWRATAGHWAWGGFYIAQWQKPCVELGIAGIIVGVLFLLVAREVQGESPLRRSRVHLDRKTSLRVLAIGAILGFRDFAGVAGFSLAGIYLLRALHFGVKETGAVLGITMLLSVLVNPTLVWLTPNRRRLPAMRFILILGGLIAVTVPYFPAYFALPVLCAFQTCQLGSYALSDAALLERVPTTGRGRVYGLFFFVAGTMGATGPWLMGFWTDALGSKANVPGGYVLPYAALGAAMIVATLATPLIARLGPVSGTVEPITEIMPSSMGPVG
jgi:MFS family permease